MNLSRNETVRKDAIVKLFDFMKQQNIFEGVQSKHRLDIYEKKKWIGAFKVQLIVLSWKRHIVHGIPKQVPNEFGYCVPFLIQLESLLQCDDVLECIDNPKPAQDSLYRSALDGSYYKSHPVVLKYPKAMGFILYLDDLTTTEVLSSYQGQTVRNYSWTLGNVYPERRSSLRAINCLALVKSKVAKKYRNEPFLRDFINAMNRLSSDEGVKFVIKGVERVFHGFLMFVIGDYPASGNLGGFKESPAKATRPCRQCMVYQCELHSKTRESEVTLRSAALHAEQIRDLKAHNFIPENEEDKRQNEEEEAEDADTEDSDEDEDMEDGDIDKSNINLSAKYGINHESCLLKLNHFDISKCLPQDIQHLFLEGILEIGSRLLLQHSISEKKMTLKKVNAFLESHDYGELRTDKPSPIEAQHVKSGLRQNSSQMLMLGSLLPFIVKDHCDKAKLSNFILLLMILGICMSRAIREEEVHVLRILIHNYLINFNDLFPGSFVPKHHFLIHLATQILLFGPLTESWAMRFESFHARMKRLTKIIHCAKNLAYSILSRLLRQRALQYRKYGDKFMTYDAVCAHVTGESAVSRLAFKECVMSVKRNLQETDVVSEVGKLCYYGSSFQPGSIIFTGEEKNQLPLFGHVCFIYSHKNDFIVVYRQLVTVSFRSDLNAFKVKLTGKGCYTALNITSKYEMHSLMHIKTEDADYIVLRQNSKPLFRSLIADV